MNRKHELRRLLIERRLAISSHRRNEARKGVLQELLPQLDAFQSILSFASKEEEIDLWPLNAHLAKEKRLHLTKVIHATLIPFHVADLALDLEETRRWRLKEPVPARCQASQIEKIDCILVPGLGFDKHHHRLGYGLGHFDRFLASVSCPTYGIGFKEQFLQEPIPIESHDVPLKEIYLF